MTLKEYPDQEKHERPEDFKEKFPGWIGTILGINVPGKLDGSEHSQKESP